MKATSNFFVRNFAPSSGTCFVLMPFIEALTAVYEHGIKPQVELMGMICKRADEIYSSQGILEDVWNSIQSAELIIADCTGKNPNVMYELGLCHALWKKVILISQNREDVPFDLKQWRVIWYDFTFSGATRLKEELGRAIKAVRDESHIEAQIIPLGGLSNKYEASEREAKWLQGKIGLWKSERNFGFIESNGESYWFNKDYLFTSDMKVEEEARVSFVPLDPLPSAKNGRASQVFVDGTKLYGQINKVLKNKNCAFATVIGQHTKSVSVYIELDTNSSLDVGNEIEFTVSQNRFGPIGVNAKQST